VESNNSRSSILLTTRLLVAILDDVQKDIAGLKRKCPYEFLEKKYLLLENAHFNMQMLQSVLNMRESCAGFRISIHHRTTTKPASNIRQRPATGSWNTKLTRNGFKAK
jgi:hypothetical protein